MAAASGRGGIPKAPPAGGSGSSTANTAQGGAAGLASNAQVTELIVRLLTVKGEPMVKEVQKRLDTGQPLIIKGTSVTPETLRAALAEFRAKSGPSVTTATPKPETAPAVALLSSNGATSAASDVQRWMPTSSAAALANKALLECESAEPFCHAVKVIGANKVGILQKPSVLGRPTGEYLNPSDTAEVIARAAVPRDGRVYLRLKHKEGWVCTRSRKDLDKPILALAIAEGGVELEPQGFGPALRSKAIGVLTLVDEQNKPVASAGIETVSNQRESREFVALISCPILSAPSFATGLTMQGVKVSARDIFTVDGVCWQTCDGRAYLRLQDGRGWICERARADYGRLAVEPRGAQGSCSATDLLASGGVGGSRRRMVVMDRGEEGIGGLAARLSRRGFSASELLPKPATMTARSPAPSARGPRVRSVGVASESAIQAEVEEAVPELPAPELPKHTGPSIFRSDRELWPPPLGPPRPLTSEARRKLRKLFVFFGQKARQCEQDMEEIDNRCSAFSRSCPALKELQGYADALKKEITKIHRDWVKAIKEACGDSLGEANAAEVVEPSDPSAGAAGVAPAQLLGRRFYCAALPDQASNDEQGSTGSKRFLGPLRSTSNEALEDLGRMKHHLRGNEEPTEATAPKRRRIAGQAAAEGGG